MRKGDEKMNCKKDDVDFSAFDWCDEQNKAYSDRVDEQNKAYINKNDVQSYDQLVYYVLAFCAGMLATAAIAMIVLR